MNVGRATPLLPVPQLELVDRSFAWATLAVVVACVLLERAHHELDELRDRLRELERRTRESVEESS